MTQTVRAVERAIDLLFLIAEKDCSLQELSLQTELSKATILRLIATLETRELVRRDPKTNLYSPGTGIQRLQRGLLSTRDAIIEASREALARVNEVTGETAGVHVRMRNDRVCIAEVESPHMLKFVAKVGSVKPLYVSSIGKLMMAYLPTAEVDELLDTMEMKAWTENTVIEKPLLKKQLAIIREQGYSCSYCEIYAGASSLSVPVLDSRGECRATLSIYGPLSRLTPERIEQFVPLLREEAEGIARKLSY